MPGGEAMREEISIVLAWGKRRAAFNEDLPLLVDGALLSAEP
jgi:hypothetical protein